MASSTSVFGNDQYGGLTAEWKADREVEFTTTVHYQVGDRVCCTEDGPFDDPNVIGTIMDVYTEPMNENLWIVVRFPNVDDLEFCLTEKQMKHASLWTGNPGAALKLPAGSDWGTAPRRTGKSISAKALDDVWFDGPTASEDRGLIKRVEDIQRKIEEISRIRLIKDTTILAVDEYDALFPKDPPATSIKSSLTQAQRDEIRRTLTKKMDEWAGSVITPEKLYTWMGTTKADGTSSEFVIPKHERFERR